MEVYLMCICVNRWTNLGMGCATAFGVCSVCSRVAASALLSSRLPLLWSLSLSLSLYIYIYIGTVPRDSTSSAAPQVGHHFAHNPFPTHDAHAVAHPGKGKYAYTYYIRIYVLKGKYVYMYLRSCSPRQRCYVNVNTCIRIYM
jgi:hypothetical protein